MHLALLSSSILILYGWSIADLVWSVLWEFKHPLNDCRQSYCSTRRTRFCSRIGCENLIPLHLVYIVVVVVQKVLWRLRFRRRKICSVATNMQCGTNKVTWYCIYRWRMVMPYSYSLRLCSMLSLTYQSIREFEHRIIQYAHEKKKHAHITRNWW